MSLYINQIEQLIVLQKLDGEIIDLEDLINEAPKKISALEEKLTKQKNQQKELSEKIDILIEQEKKLNQEIEEDNTRIKKSKNKLMMTRNSKEYHAMMREMDNLEKTNRMREEEKVALEEDLANQQDYLDSLNEEIERIQEEYQELQQNMEIELGRSREKLEELKSSREEARQKISKPILSRYEFIRSRLNNPVIVPVEGGVCKGCNINIPPQTFIELQKGEQILSCPNCQRLIYWKGHFDNPEINAGTVSVSNA